MGDSFVNTHNPAMTVLSAGAARLFRMSTWLAAKAANGGQLAAFVVWQRRVFGHPLELCSSRERLWNRCRQQLHASPLVVFEFGVAHGYATNWWLQRLGRNVTWHGFDRFTGLPRAWAVHEEGAFDNGGQPPAINDPRVHWHVGDVQDTLKEIDVTRSGERWLILFDLDIYEPTAYAWKKLAEHLRPGDVIYFDEPCDHDERRVLDELVLPSIQCEPIGVTAAALAVVVK